MRIAVDNLDGLGAVDYTAFVAAEGPVTIERGLNVPSRCVAEIVLDGVATPKRLGRVTVTSDAGAVLFTGYVATEPVRVYAGAGSEGAVYRARISAVSDEWTLDKLGSGAGRNEAASFALDGAGLVSRLAERVAGASLPVSAAGTSNATGSFGVRAAAAWSANAGDAAGAAYAGYRALDGSVLVQTAGTATHALSDADGTLNVSELALGNVRELANDVTVSGAEEPGAYVSECFVGDGTTASFELSEVAYRDTQRTLLSDSFQGAGFDRTQWMVSDPAGRLALTAAGLTLNGGTGTYGGTTVTGIDVIEMGGSIVAELGSVAFGAASDGVLAGFYEGPTIPAACFAGFRVRQSTSGTGGVTVVAPVVNGAEVGTVFTPASGHLYTLRLRLHCVEMQRVMQRYYTMVDGVIAGFGELSGVTAPMDVVFEVVDQGVSSSTPATVLYDSFAAGAPVVSSPATCSFVAMNATEMFGSVGSVSVTRPGSLWVTSVLPSGTPMTRLVGMAGQGVDCEASYGTAAGAQAKVTFFSGRVPAANERVVVSYRTRNRSVARMANAASVAAEAVGGASGTSRWYGKVLQPVARSSADCESAAAAVLAFATSRSAAVAGSYGVVNPAADIWPGDVLAMTSAGVTTSVLVRSVVVKDGASAPETMAYAVKFANDWATEWADGLGLKLSEAIAADAVLPATASNGAPVYAANLQGLSVTALSTTALQVDAGCDAPSGGGFEVRRKDWAFGVGVDPADLVLRSPVRNFSIPRAAQSERYFVRIYDASTPAVYSRWSSAVFVNAPVG